MASNVENNSSFHNHYEPYTKTKPPKTKPKAPDKSPNGNARPPPSNTQIPAPSNPSASPPALSYTNYTPESPTPTHSLKRGHDATPNSTRHAKQAHLHRSPAQITPINLPTTLQRPDLDMLDPIDESALFNPSQANIDWSHSEQQSTHNRKVLNLLKELLAEFTRAQANQRLDPILEDDEIAEALHDLATFFPSYIVPSQLKPISAGIEEIRKLVEQVTQSLDRPVTSHGPDPLDPSLNSSAHAPQRSTIPPQKTSPPTQAQAKPSYAQKTHSMQTIPPTTKATPNPNSSHHPSRLVINFLPNGLQTNLKPDPSAIVNDINSTLALKSASKHLKVVAASFNNQGNLILSTRADQTAADLIKFHNDFAPNLSRLSNNQQFTLREDRKWYKIQIDGVNTTSNSIGNERVINSADLIHMELAACNPLYANSQDAIVAKPRWLRTVKELHTTPRSSLVFALSDEKLARQFLSQKFLAAYGRHCSVQAFQDHPPVTQCCNCWRLSHNSHQCKEETRCRICSGLHAEADHPRTDPSNCATCRDAIDRGDSMDTTNEGQCPHDLRCLNCLSDSNKEHNHPADARRCPSRLEMYGTARENERRASKSENPWVKAKTKRLKPKNQNTTTSSSTPTNRFDPITPHITPQPPHNTTSSNPCPSSSS